MNYIFEKRIITKNVYFSAITIGFMFYFMYIFWQMGTLIKVNLIMTCWNLILNWRIRTSNKSISLIDDAFERPGETKRIEVVFIFCFFTLTT